MKLGLVKSRWNVMDSEDVPAECSCDWGQVQHKVTKGIRIYSAPQIYWVSMPSLQYYQNKY